MPNPSKLDILRKLRDGKGLSQAAVAKIFGFKGRSARDHISKWENGEKPPPTKHREQFFRYLVDDLGLGNDKERLVQIWNMLVEEWQWLPLSTSELQYLNKRQAEESFPPTAGDRELVYSIPDNQLELEAEVSRWQLLPTDLAWQVLGDTITIGLPSINSYIRPSLIRLENCSVECRLRIIDDGNDNENWAGIRVRGFHTEFEDFGLGYLVHLRNNGTTEIYRIRSSIAVSVIAKGDGEWNDLRVDISRNRIQVWINGELAIMQDDDAFGESGYIYIQVFGCTAQIKNFKIFRI